jgi:hypothetical protein
MMQLSRILQGWTAQGFCEAPEMNEMIAVFAPSKTILFCFHFMPAGLDAAAERSCVHPAHEALDMHCPACTHRL